MSTQAQSTPTPPSLETLANLAGHWEGAEDTPEGQALQWLLATCPLNSAYDALQQQAGEIGLTGAAAALSLLWTEEQLAKLLKRPNETVETVLDPDGSLGVDVEGIGRLALAHLRRGQGDSDALAGAILGLLSDAADAADNSRDTLRTTASALRRLADQLAPQIRPTKI